MLVAKNARAMLSNARKHDQRAAEEFLSDLEAVTILQYLGHVDYELKHSATGRWSAMRDQCIDDVSHDFVSRAGNGHCAYLVEDLAVPREVPQRINGLSHENNVCFGFLVHEKTSDVLLHDLMREPVRQHARVAHGDAVKRIADT